MKLYAVCNRGGTQSVTPANSAPANEKLRAANAAFLPLRRPSHLLSLLTEWTGLPPGGYFIARRAKTTGPNTKCPAWGALGPKALAKSKLTLTPFGTEGRRIADLCGGIH